MTYAETPPFDPRYNRGQSVEDAKARYIHQDGYSMKNFEYDLGRLLQSETVQEGELADALEGVDL